MKKWECWRYSKIIVCCIVFASAACNNSDDNKIPVAETNPVSSTPVFFDKLVGTWKNANGKSFEHWAKNPGGTFHSKVFSIKGIDTSYMEEAIIYQENNNWVFENKVKGQNDGQAVKFTSTLLSDSAVQFSNPAHDFPTDVNYHIIDSINLKAFIIGPSSAGGKDTFYFNYQKLK